MKNFKVYAATLMSLFVGSLALAENSSLQSAANFYDKGECEEAIAAYESALDSARLNAEEKSIAHFRIGYCSYNLENYEKAIEEFKMVLAASPDEDEARLKYAESLFANEEYELAVKEALKVKDADYVSDAKLLAARGYIEIQDSDRALSVLKSLDGNNELAPVIDFWRGMAHFQNFNENAAAQSFKRSLKNSPDDWWTKSASNNWLQTLADSSRSYHARFGVSAGSDSNLAQSTYRDSKNSPPNSAYYVSDTYLSGDMYFGLKPIRTDKVSWVPSFNASNLKYSKTSNNSYNYSSVGSDLTATYNASYKWTLRSSLSYSETRYNGSYYHNYLGFNLGAIYGLSKRTSLSTTLYYTKTIGNDPSESVGPSIGVEGDTNLFYWLASVSYSKASGNKATYTATGPYSVTSGAVASNYETMTAKAGIGRILPWELDLLFTVTSSSTTYAKEFVPPPAAFSVEQRKDSELVLSASLSKTLIERRMTLTANISQTKNTSDGYQGLAYSSGTSPDYNYDRTQFSTYLSYGF